MRNSLEWAPLAMGMIAAFTIAGVVSGCGGAPPAANACAMPPKPEPEKPKKDDFGVCTDAPPDGGLADAADAP